MIHQSVGFLESDFLINEPWPNETEDTEQSILKQKKKQDGQTLQ